MEGPPQTVSPQADPYPITLNTLVTALVIGAFVGTAGWLITLFLQQYFIGPVFCTGSDSLSACTNGSTIAWALAHILVIGASVVAMVRFVIYRPLLVALAAIVTLWGINSWLDGQVWWSAALLQALLFGLAYGTYAWIARTRQFWFAALATVLVIVLCRFVLSWA